MLTIWGKTPDSAGTCVVHKAIGYVTTCYIDYVWVLEVTLVHDAYGLFVIQIAPVNNDGHRETEHLLVISWGRSRRSAQQAGDRWGLWGSTGVPSPQGAMSGPRLIARRPIRAAAANGISSFYALEQQISRS